MSSSARSLGCFSAFALLFLSLPALARTPLQQMLEGAPPSAGRTPALNRAQEEVALRAAIAQGGRPATAPAASWPRSFCARDEDGCVKQLVIKQGLSSDLDQAALQALRHWVFKPAMFQGQPVKVFYHLTINFAVDSPNP